MSHRTGSEVVQVMGNTTFGGDAFVVVGICEAVSSLGLRPVILATDPQVVSFMRERGLEVWEFPGIVRPPRPLHDLMTAFRLSRALKARGPRVVHTHTSKGGMVGRLAARLAGCPAVIHHTHGFYHSALRPGLARSGMMTLERIFARMDDLQVLMSTAELEDAVARGIVPRERARLVFNGIEDPSAAPSPDRARLRERWAVPDGCPIVGTVARLELSAKALDTGIDAFSRLIRGGRDARYVILGEGPDRVLLEAQVLALGLENLVRMPGNDEDAARSLSAFDIVFSPSRREGQSISLIEAMAWRKPIVATTISNNADLLVDGVSALLCPADDADAMAQALGVLLDDPRLADRLGQGARQRYEADFTYGHFVERMRELYLEALAIGPKGDSSG